MRRRLYREALAAAAVLAVVLHTGALLAAEKAPDEPKPAERAESKGENKAEEGKAYVKEKAAAAGKKIRKANRPKIKTTVKVPARREAPR